MSSSSKFKAFKFDPIEAGDAESQPFPLEINGDEVMCVPHVDGLQLLTFLSFMRDPATPMGRRAGAMVDWLRKCIVPEDWPKFEALCAKYNLDIESLGEISGYLSEVYTERPTQSAGSSSAGQTTTGSSSEESSSSEGSSQNE